MKMVWIVLLALPCFSTAHPSSLFCEFLAKFSKLGPTLPRPLPTRLVALENITPTLLGPACPLDNFVTTLPFPASRGLLLLECLTPASCLEPLKSLFQFNLIDGMVSPRYFVLLFTHNLEVYNLVLHNILNGTEYAKMHVAIIQESRTVFVRALKNVCLAQLSPVEVEGKDLSVEVIFRHLLAVSTHGQANRVEVCNFEGSKLTAVLTRTISCAFESSQGRITKLKPSVEVNALNLLRDHFHFRYEALDANGSYGIKVDGAWQGATGFVVNGTADMALCDFIFTNDRHKVVDISFPFDMVPVTFMTRKPGRRIRKWAFFFALPILIWFMLAVAVAVLSTLLERLRSGKHEAGRGSVWFLLLSILWQQAITSSELHSFESSVSKKIIFVLWCMSTMIVMRVYSGVFYSTITVPEDVVPLDTIEELIKVLATDRGLVFTSRFLYNMARESKCCEGDLEFTLGQHLRRHRMESKINLGFDQWIKEIESYDWANTHPLFYIDSRNLLHFFTRHITFPMHIGTPTFCLDAIGLIHQKDALYAEAFRYTIQTFFEAGLYSKWFRDALSIHEYRAHQKRTHLRTLLRSLGDRKLGKSFVDMFDAHNKFARDNDHALTTEVDALRDFGLAEFESIFLVYLAGNALAFIVFLGQCLYSFFSGAKLTVIFELNR